MGYTYKAQEIEEKIFNFVYKCAMHDAILQQSFKGEEKSWVSEIKEPKIILKGYIDKILRYGFPSQESHDLSFLETANSICKEINNKRPCGINTDIFSFGNAQKLINITVKHIYTFCYQTPSLRENFRFCHCPLDAIMLGNVWKMCKGKIDLGRRKDFCKAWGSEGINNNDQPMLTSFPQRYALFQEAIRCLIGDGDMFSVEFDYTVWKS